jgi:membrane protease YdiL (CAAX protease family)
VRQSRIPVIWQIIGLLIAFGGTFAFLATDISHHNLTDAHDDVTIVFEWIVFGLLSFIAFAILRRSPDDYQVRMFGWRDAAIMLAALVGVFVFNGIAGRLLGSSPKLPSLHLSGVPLSLRVVLVLTAGTREEFMYRGFGIEELARFTGNRWTAGGLLLLFFIFGHVGRYGFSITLLVPAIARGFLTLLYLLRRNLPICMLLHAIINGIFVVIVPQFLR